MVVTGSLKIVLKEFFLRAGFLWNSNPLLSDAIKRWGEKQWRVDREMEVKRQREERMRSKESGQRAVASEGTVAQSGLQKE